MNLPNVIRVTNRSDMVDIVQKVMDNGPFGTILKSKVEEIKDMTGELIGLSISYHPEPMRTTLYVFVGEVFIFEHSYVKVLSESKIIRMIEKVKEETK